MRKDKFHAYATRQSTLLALGFTDYKAYLNSPLWKSLRAKVLRKTPNCQVCSARASCVHHTSYSREVLEGSNPRRLVALCHECHYNIEYDENSKTTLREANKRFRAVRKKKNRSRVGGQLMYNQALLTFLDSVWSTDTVEKDRAVLMELVTPKKLERRQKRYVSREGRKTLRRQSKVKVE